MAEKIGTSSIRIREEDLKNDCTRLNRRLDLMDQFVSQTVAQALSKTTSPSSSITTIVAAGGSYVTPPPEPVFAVDRSPWDSSVAEVSGLAFAAPASVKGETTATFVFYYVDESITEPTLTSDMTLLGSSMVVNTIGDLVDGDYALVDGEIIRLEDHATLTFPVVRTQLGSIGATHTTGTTVRNVITRTVTAAFPDDFFLKDDSDGWFLDQPLPDMKLVAVTCVVANSGGNSTVHVVCKTANTDHGLRLPTVAPPGSGEATFRIINDNATPSLSGVGSTGSPFQLLAEAQTLYVTATTQAVFLLLPAEASMVGVSVTVKLADGSTFPVWLRSGSGDDLEGSAADYEISTAGSITITGMAGGHWIITAQAGSVTSPPAPDAPNVLNTVDHPTTVTVVYSCPWNDPIYQFSASVSIDLGDANIGHLKKIHAKNSLTDQDVGVIPQPSGGWSTTPVALLPDKWTFQDADTHTGDIIFDCENDDGNITADPVRIPFTVQATLVSAVSGADASTLDPADPEYHARFQDSSTGLHTVINVHVSMANAQYPNTATFWIDKQDGKGPLWQGWRSVTEDDQLVQFGLPDSTTYVYPPGSFDGSWLLIAAAGAVMGEAAVPSTAVTSAAFPVPAIPAPAITWATRAYIDQINYGDNGQMPTWGWNNLFTTLPYDNPNFWFGRWTKQNGSLIGGIFTPSPIGQDGAELVFSDDDLGALKIPGTNTVTIVNHLMWGLPSYKLTDGSLNPYSCFRFRCYCGSRRDTDGSGGTVIQQNCWSSGVGVSTPGTADHFDVVLDLTKARIQGQQIADATITGTQIANATITGTNITNATITGADIANATISGTNIQNATITGSNIANATIAGANITNATITGTQIANATIAGANIGTATITGSQIAAATIAGSNIAAATIAGSNIAAAAVAGSNIAASTVAGSNIAASTVAGSNIAASTVAGSNIESLTIAAANIANLTINGVKLATGAVSDSTKVANQAIAGSNIATATIVGTNIANATIVGTNIANATITGSNVQNGAITATNIATATITAYQIATGTITATNIQNATIIGWNIANATVTGTNIASLTITASNIANLTITSAQITNATITSTQIGNLTITATQIANLTITASQIALGTITADRLAVNTLTVANITGWDGAAISIGGGGLSFTGSAGISMFGGGDIAASPGSVKGHLVRCDDSSVLGAFYCGAYAGLATTTRVVKDGSGNNKTVTIRGGIITAWDL